MGKYILSNNAQIEVKSDGEKVTMHWKGTIDFYNTDNLLVKYLHDFHDKCKEQGIRELDVDFTQLDYMNSSGIKNVIRWLRDVSNDNQYKTTVHINVDFSWQDITFSTFDQLLQNVEFSQK
jgi:anti-anti-sigma regulatory factor